MTFVGVVGASAAFAVGTVGMAQAEPHDAQVHKGQEPISLASGMAGMSSHVTTDSSARPLSQHEVARIRAAGALPRLHGKVNRARVIAISANPVPSGRYRLVVKDTARRHNWHIVGSGVDQRTGIHAMGTWKWRVNLQPGDYTVMCDVHYVRMRFTVTVT